MKEIGQDLTSFVSWKDLRRLYSGRSSVNGPRKLRQLCQLKAEEKLQVRIVVMDYFFLLIMDYILFIFLTLLKLIDI